MKSAERWLLQWLAFAAIMVPAGAIAGPGDSLTLADGGTWGFSSLSINLDDGTFVQREQDIGNPVARKRAGVIGPVQLEGLRSTARLVLKHGTWSQACMAEAKRSRFPVVEAPNFDSYVSLDGAVDGREISAPRTGRCWSAEVNELGGVMKRVAAAAEQYQVQ